jgi:hypothetical protein
MSWDISLLAEYTVSAQKLHLCKDSSHLQEASLCALTHSFYEAGMVVAYRCIAISGVKFVGAANRHAGCRAGLSVRKPVDDNSQGVQRLKSFGRLTVEIRPKVTRKPRPRILSADRLIAKALGWRTHSTENYNRTIP